MKSFQYPTVDKQLLDEVVQQITAVGSPLKIVLFGSRARGDEHLESDLDLLVIEESNLPTYQRASRYYFALKGISIPKDIVVNPSGGLRLERRSQCLYNYSRSGRQSAL